MPENLQMPGKCFRWRIAAISGSIAFVIAFTTSFLLSRYVVSKLCVCDGARFCLKNKDYCSGKCACYCAEEENNWKHGHCETGDYPAYTIVAICCIYFVVGFLSAFVATRVVLSRACIRWNLGTVDSSSVAPDENRNIEIADSKILH